MDLEDQLAALNPQPGERFSANYQIGSSGTMVSFLFEPERIPSYIRDLPRNADIWIGVNPVGAWVTEGRGLASDVTRLAALYADLDEKPGGCPNLGVAEDIIDDLSGLLGESITYMVYTGHGIHPVWAIDPEENWPNAELAALLRRWGQLVKLVAKRRGAGADSVFDLSRILRAVETRNNKDNVPIDVAGMMGTGGPLTLSQIDERLNEAGIYAPEPADLDLDDTVPVGGRWSMTECSYCAKAFEAWALETPYERHPWLVKQFTRLESMRLLGCLTFAQYQRGANVLVDRFTWLCANTGKTRRVKPLEIEDAHDWGERRAASKSASELSSEVGKHQHDFMGSIINPDQPQGFSTAMPPPTSAEAEGEPDLFRRIFEAEQDFWTSRDSLKRIFETAMARMVSPWAVLAYCAARMLYLVPASVKLPALIGGRGSLNWFAIVVDYSSGGKSAAAAVAEELVCPAFPVTIKVKTPGSGEGIIGQYYDPPVPPSKVRPRREAVMFTTDEIDTLTAMGQRQGGTTLATLRTAFSGGTLGFSYTKGNDAHVNAHTYRMTFIVNAQPSRTGGLLADHGGGTPQRFMWFPANDLRPTMATANENYVPAGIPIPHGLAMLGDKTIQIPREARDMILAEREKALHGERDCLDGHALFCREKFAYALALMDDRVDMGEEDWRLSGIAAEVSSRTREWVQHELTKSLETEAEERGRISGVQYAAADRTKAGWAPKKIHTLKNWILKRLKAEPMTTGELRRQARSDNRDFIEEAVSVLLGESMIEQDDDEKWRIRA
jgi:hypothetical protein